MITITIDHDEMVELLTEHLQGMFRTLEIENIYGIGYGDVTARLKKPVQPVEAAPALERPLGPPDDEIQF